MQPNSPWIINGTVENFETDVLQRSQELPVIVDFWATWCGPCKELGPLLEKLAEEAAGNWLLVKVDVDQQPQLAQAFGVQQIPVVFALRDGQVVDQFMGAVPEPALREWLAQFQPSPFDMKMAEAKVLESSNVTEAEEKYQEAMELAPDKDIVKVQLARFYLAQHRDADSRKILAELEARGFLEPEAESIKAELDLRAAAAEAGGVGECRAAVAANPSDPALKLKLADALAAVKQYPEALELLLDLVIATTGDLREEAKKTMINIFQLLGPEVDLTRTYRRKLATALY